MAHEVSDQPAAVRRVNHLRVELHAVEPPVVVRDHGEVGAFRRGHWAEAGGEFADLVAVAHPHLMPLTLSPEAVEQPAAVRDLHERPPKLAHVGVGDPAAQLLHHQLLAVANPQDGHAGFVKMLGHLRGVRIRHGPWPARQDQPGGLQTLPRLLRGGVGCDLRIDARLADPTRDQLGHLTAEIHDQHRLLALGNRRGVRCLGFGHGA